MLSASCPSCGAPVPVSLATPDAVACTSCGYRGLPDAQVRAELHEALQVLWQMQAGDRQLSGAQRLNVQAARSYMKVFVVGFLLVMTPVMIFSGSCLALAAPGPESQGTNVVLVGLGLFPLIVSACVAALTLRYVYRRGDTITDRCAALAPLREGEPLRCHVCGAPLLAYPTSAIARCGFCQADNVVTPSVLSRVGAKRAVRVGRIVEQVHAESRALDQNAVAAGLVAAGVIIASPILGIALFVAVQIVASFVELGPIAGAEYVSLGVTNTECIARVVREKSGDVAEFENAVPGIPTRAPLAPGLRRYSSNELVGRELALEDSRRGRVTRVYRSFLEPAADRIELDVGGAKESTKLAGACQVSSRRRIVSTDPRWERAKCLRARDGKIWFAVDNAIYSVPQAGGEATTVSDGGDSVLDFRLYGNAVIVLRQPRALDEGTVLERHTGGKIEEIADKVVSFAPDGEDLFIGRTNGLYRRDVNGTLTPIDASGAVSFIAVSSAAIYWATSEGAVLELTKSSGGVRTLDRLRQPSGLVRAGQFLYVSHAAGPISIIPLAGGTRFDVLVRDLTQSGMESNDNAVFFPVTRYGRGGVLSLPAGSKDVTGARYYGPDTRETASLALDSGEVFWLDGTNIVAEPLAP